jgi:hypothetical protein
VPLPRSGLLERKHAVDAGRCIFSDSVLSGSRASVSPRATRAFRVLWGIERKCPPVNNLRPMQPADFCRSRPARTRKHSRFPYPRSSEPTSMDGPVSM